MCFGYRIELLTVVIIRGILQQYDMVRFVFVAEEYVARSLVQIPANAGDRLEHRLIVCSIVLCLLLLLIALVHLRQVGAQACMVVVKLPELMVGNA